MNIPFFNRPSIRKITVGAASEDSKLARTLIEQLLRDMPELLMTCVVEVNSGRVLASYTTASALNPNQINLRYAKLLRQTTTALQERQIPGEMLTDMTMLLEDQLHMLRPLRQGQWFCFVALRFADTNLGMAWDIVRRHTAA